MVAPSSDFAPTLRAYRLKAGLSQEALAERSGISTRAISDMERGLRKRPYPDTIRRIAAALDLSSEDRAILFGIHRPESDKTAVLGEAGFRVPLALPPLPKPFDSLVGRSAEISMLVITLGEDRARLVTLVGPGGVGKTRLGLEVTAKLASRFADGVAFVDLAPLTEPDQVVMALTSIIEQTSNPSAPPRQALVAALRNRELLIVLDNFEHLVDAATLVSDLLATCPRLTILATSRVPLRLRGERRIPVAPLTTPKIAETSVDRIRESPAIELFNQRAQQVDPLFMVDSQNALIVSEICRRLDGLPLAIELAASRVSTLPPDALIERLPELGGGPRDAPARQQTLRNTIAWSYDLLPPAEQSVFRRLAIFSGGFSLDAALAVADEGAGDTLEIVARLAEASLLTTIRPSSGELRYAMFETIQRFATERLNDTSELTAIQQRHADWVGDFMERAGSPSIPFQDTGLWIERFDREVPNIRSAMQLLIEQGSCDQVFHLVAVSSDYWSYRPDGREIQRWLEETLPCLQLPPDEDKVTALALLTMAYAYYGNRQQATAISPLLETWSAMVGTPYAHGIAWYGRGLAAEFSGDLPGSVAYHEQALAWFRQTERVSKILFSTVELGNALLIAGEVERAVEILNGGIELSRDVGAEVELASGLLFEDSPRWPNPIWSGRFVICPSPRAL